MMEMTGGTARIVSRRHAPQVQSSRGDVHKLLFLFMLHLCAHRQDHCAAVRRPQRPFNGRGRENGRLSLYLMHLPKTFTFGQALSVDR